MNDRVTVATLSSWHHFDTPPVGKTVEIYREWTVMQATYDGQCWRNQAGEPVAVSAWWREVQR